MHFKKKIDYYLENGPEIVKPTSKEFLAKQILLTNDPIKDILSSPFCWPDALILDKLDHCSKNLIKYYPWKLFLEIAQARGLDVQYYLDKMPEIIFFRKVDEDIFPPE